MGVYGVRTAGTVHRIAPASAQPTLFEPLPPMVAPTYQKGDTIEQRFNAFHAANPKICEALRRLALDMRRHGMSRWSINAAFEVLRWQVAITTNSADFKLNNDFRSLYARLLMDSDPLLDGFFETRCRRTE